MKNITLLSGGAAQSLVTQLEHRFETEHRCTIDASFGAVGMMNDPRHRQRVASALPAG